MPRKLRTQYPGAIYHVMNREDHQELIFGDDEDRKDNMGWSGWEEFRNLTPNDKTNLQEQE